MTSNTIANAANLEAARHNVVNEQLGSDTLAETTRHNKAMETLQNDANVINSEKNQITKTYNDESLRLDYELRIRQQNLDKYLGAERIKIQQEINSLTAQKNTNEAWYQQRSTELQLQDIDNKRAQNLELNRHNNAMETLGLYETSQNVLLRENQLRFDKYKLDIESGLRRQEIDEIKNRNDIAFLNYVSDANYKQDSIDIQSTLAGNTLQNDSQRRWWTPFTNLWSGGFSTFIPQIRLGGTLR